MQSAFSYLSASGISFHKERDELLKKEFQVRFEASGGVYILAYSLDDIMTIL
jgi:hypothetical protein